MSTRDEARRDAIRRIVAAVQTLLERREDQMVTSEEWKNLQAASDAYLVVTGACPHCAEHDTDRLIWLDDEQVECQGCKTRYRPGVRPPAAPKLGCEFCWQAYNHRDGPWECPYCGQKWNAAGAPERPG